MLLSCMALRNLSFVVVFLSRLSFREEMNEEVRAGRIYFVTSF